LLQAGCNPNFHNKKGVMPISAAAHKGDTVIMELLITKGALVDALNVSGSTALIQV
jgi:ankyrin repeat protein